MQYFIKLMTALACIFTVSLAQALEKEDYSQERFDELQAAGTVVLLDVYASWCPTCAKQQTALEAYGKAHPDADFHVLVIDYDDNKDLVRKYRAPRQSTLFIYKAHRQVWFSVAETRPEVIAAAINEAIDMQPSS